MEMARMQPLGLRRSPPRNQDSMKSLNRSLKKFNQSQSQFQSQSQLKKKHRKKTRKQMLIRQIPVLLIQKQPMLEMMQL